MGWFEDMMAQRIAAAAPPPVDSTAPENAMRPEFPPAHWFDSPAPPVPVPPPNLFAPSIASTPPTQANTPDLATPPAPPPNSLPAGPPGAVPEPGQLQPGLGVPADVLDKVASSLPAPAAPPPGWGGIPYSLTDQDPAFAPPGIEDRVGAESLPGREEEDRAENEQRLLDLQKPVGITGTPGAPDEYDDPLSTKNLLRLTEDPVYAFRKEAEADTANQDWLRSKQAEAVQRDEAEAAASMRRWQEGVRRIDQQRTQLEVEAARLAHAEPHSGRWWGSRDTGQKIGAIIAAVVGGLVSGQTGRPNEGMAWIERQIDRDIEFQKANILAQRDNVKSRQSLLGEQYARLGDMRAAEDQFRLAAMKRVERQLEIELAGRDPRGAQAFKLAATLRDWKAKQAEAYAKWSEGQIKALLEAEKAKREAEKFAEEKRAKAEAERLARQKRDDEVADNRTKNSLTGARIAEDRRQANQRAVIDVAGQQLAFAGKMLEQRGKDAAAAKQDARELRIGGLPQLDRDDKGNLVIGADGKPKITYGTDLVQKDGKTPFEAPTKEAAQKLRDKTAAGEQITVILDKIMAIRDDVGGESSWANSDAYQQLQVLKNNLTILKKSGTEGMSSDEDMNKIDAALGADSVTSFRARKAGLLEARKRVEEELDSHYRRARYTGAKITFPNLAEAPKPVVSADDEKFKESIKKPSISPDEADDQAIAIVKRRYAKELADPATQAAAWVKVGAESKALAARYKDITPDQGETIRELTDRARAGDTAALARLKVGREQAGTEALRDAYALAIQQSQSPDFSKGGEVTNNYDGPDLSNFTGGK